MHRIPATLIPYLFVPSKNKQTYNQSATPEWNRVRNSVFPTFSQLPGGSLTWYERLRWARSRSPKAEEGKEMFITWSETVNPRRTLRLNMVIIVTLRKLNSLSINACFQKPNSFIIKKFKKSEHKMVNSTYSISLIYVLSAVYRGRNKGRAPGVSLCLWWDGGGHAVCKIHSGQCIVSSKSLLSCITLLRQQLPW